MEKTISVPYKINEQEDAISIPLTYNIAMNGDVQTISCSVTPSKESIPGWLQPHKFEIKSLFNNGVYETLFDYDDKVKNLDTALFIDKAHAVIMSKELPKAKVVFN